MIGLGVASREARVPLGGRLMRTINPAIEKVTALRHADRRAVSTAHLNISIAASEGGFRNIEIQVDEAVDFIGGEINIDVRPFHRADGGRVAVIGFSTGGRCSSRTYRCDRGNGWDRGCRNNRRVDRHRSRCIR